MKPSLARCAIVAVSVVLLSCGSGSSAAPAASTSGARDAAATAGVPEIGPLPPTHERNEGGAVCVADGGAPYVAEHC